MVFLVSIVASLCAASAMRTAEREDVEVTAVEQVDMEAIDFATEEVEDFVNGTKGWAKPRQLVVDIAVADARFRSKLEPLLVPGEVIEMAFFDEYRDWTLFTNWRVVEVDGEATAFSGYGKTAVANRVHYRSQLWSSLLRNQRFVKVVTATSSVDPDVEVHILPGGKSFEFSKNIGGQKHFEIGDFLRDKIKVHGAEAVPPTCSWEDINWGRDKWQSPRICRVQPESEVKLNHFLTLLTVPGIGIIAPSTQSLEELLGANRPMIKKDETILYTFTETWSAVKRYDSMIITDKQIVTVDAKLPKKMQYVSYPYPEGMQPMQIFERIESWTMSTAQRKGIDRDCELEVQLTVGAGAGVGAAAAAAAAAGAGLSVFARAQAARLHALKTTPLAAGGTYPKVFQGHFGKKEVSTADLFKYHSKLQELVLSAKKIQ